MADSAPAIIIIYTAYIWPNTSSKLKEVISMRNVTASSIISIEISIKIIFFLFNTNPSTPTKNSINDRSIHIAMLVNSVYPLWFLSILIIYL